MTAAGPTRDCPICGGAERRVFFHQEFATVDYATPVTGYDVVVPLAKLEDRYVPSVSRIVDALRKVMETA